jgi:hypothetical protein
VYAPTFQAVKTAQVLVNHAFEGPAFVEAQVKLAEVAFGAYERIRAAAAKMPADGDLSSKEAMAVNVVRVALSLHDAHVDTGSKVAALPDYLASVLQKLASAVLVDEVLLEQLPTLEGETKLAAESCRALGREYIMTLVGEILP